MTSRFFGIYSRHSPLRAKFQQYVNNRTEEDLVAYLEKQASDLEQAAEDLQVILGRVKDIYPRSKTEFDIRLTYITDALGCINSIKTILKRVVKYFDLDLNVFKETVLLLEKEKDLILKLRRSDRRRFGQFL